MAVGGLNRLVAEAADPASVQHCTSARQVRYCLYPGFGRQLPELRTPVSEVLRYLPVRPGGSLTLEQVLTSDLLNSTLTHGHRSQQVSRWTAQVRQAPGSVASASVIYLPVGDWPAPGAQQADARFDVALAAGYWAARIPPQATGTPDGSLFLPCVPVDQAREAIAIWLASVSPGDPGHPGP